MKSNAEWPTRMGGVTIDEYSNCTLPPSYVEGVFYFREKQRNV